MKTVLITDAEALASLAIVRSLAKKNISVSCIGEKKSDICFSSLYVKEKIILLPYNENRDKYIASLIQILKNRKYDLLIPVTDASLTLISENYNKLCKYAKISIPTNSVVKRILNKEEVLKKAKSLGIPVPKTFFIKNLKELKDFSEKTNYPLVIKPKFSRFWFKGELTKGEVDFIGNSKELISKYKKIDKKSPRPLVQEMLKGEERGVFVFIHQGETKAIFAHKRLKSLNKNGGVSVIRESIALDSELKDNSIKLLKALNWEGVAMVEFKKDLKDNKFKLMEINPRFWGSLQLAIESGVDFPYLYYQAAIGKEANPVLKYKTGIKCRWLYGDFSRLLNILRKPNKISNKMKEALQFFNFLNYRYDDFRLDDPLIIFNEFYHLFIEVIRKIVGIKNED